MAREERDEIAFHEGQFAGQAGGAVHVGTQVLITVANKLLATRDSGPKFQIFGFGREFNSSKLLIASGAVAEVTPAIIYPWLAPSFLLC